MWQVFLTRASLKTSQLMTADAIRSRLDSQAPDVTLKLSPPPLEPQAWNSTGMPCNTWPQGHRWHFPADQDGANRLVPQQVLVLENLSDRRVEARFDGDLVVADEDRRPSPAGVIVLEPGESSPLHGPVLTTGEHPPYPPDPGALWRTETPMPTGYSTDRQDKRPAW
ncbi:hypothetical protein G9272_01305 [Streptomyces asoensis]|uniref:Uncharacterized protein n=1 Tax=Streptomyces asoensis TaxID=249586 RepID=A0A6M4WG25_9ACTN|nr:hypothetical protein [Streptomyces asoensis]QJS99128.1 hypothetical protein G9272_01305 [Streptomyces asoensis]